MKKLYLLFLLIILSGCSVQYKLDIDKNINLIEKISVTALSKTESEQIKNYDGYLPIDIELDEPYIFEEKVEGIEYYDIKKNDNNSNINFNYSYNIDKFNNNIFVKNCYKYVTTTKKENELILSTSKEFLCFEQYEELENVTVTITSKYKLKETNADTVEHNQYIWNINKSNANNRNLYLSLDISKRDLNFLEKLKEGEYTSIFTLTITLLLIGIVVYFIIKRKGDIRNKI